MLTIETREIKISEELKRRIEMIGRFTNTNPLITNRSIINIKGTNIAYVESHKININNLYAKIKLKDLKNHIKIFK